jgi:phospholipid-binding lipoprotein MlaA
VDQIQIARFVVDGIDQRARVIDVLDDLEKNSLDFYAQLRSLSQQKRAAELRHGAAPEPGSDFYQDPNKSPDARPSAAAPQQPGSGNLAPGGPPPASPALVRPGANTAARPRSSRS